MISHISIDDNFSMKDKSDKSASRMGVLETPKSVPAMSTRAKEAGKRGLEDIVEVSSGRNKKKQTPSGTAPALGNKDSAAEGNKSSYVTSTHPPIQPPQEDVEDNRPVNKSTLNNHVALLMEKLNSIEGNTVTLNREVSSIFSKLDEQSTRIKGTETSVSLHDQQIGELKKKNSALTQQLGELKKRQSTMVEEVNSNVGDQMKSFRDSLCKDNELFRAEIINVTNKKIESTTNSIREDFMEEQSQSRKNNGT